MQNTISKMLVAFLFSIIIVTFLSCNSQEEDSDIIEIDITDGDRNEKEFKLSEIVDDVEYIKLETRNDCFISNGRFDISENFLLISNRYHPSQVMLFKRDGRLHTLIGEQGKGPSEYITTHPQAKIAPNEEWVIVHDSDAKKLLQYSKDGTFLRSYVYSQTADNRLSDFKINSDQEIVLIFYRPMEAVEQYPILRILDENLTLVEESFHISKQKSNGYDSAGKATLLIENDELFLREGFYDTLFQKKENQFVPKYHFNYTDNSPTSYFSPISKKFDTFIWLSMIGKYFMCQTVLYIDDGTISTYFCNRETGEIVRPSNDNTLNDIDGFGEVWISPDEPKGFVIKALDVINLKEKLGEGDYLTELIFPEKQKQLIQLIEESSIDDNAIVRVFHLKEYNQ